ncbi:MAG: tyrosine-type recombinase/integrase [Gammaproteobacteria bacterium]|nr:tyrosine-type recombinase/integrase [Gammaproteobacteria bacterium]
MGPDAWTQAQAAWLARLQFERRYSARTIAAYGRDIEALAAFARSLALVPEQMGADQARRFVATLNRQRLSARSVAQYLAAARAFYRDLRLDPNPFRGIRAPKGDRRLPSDLPVDQVQALFAAAPSTWWDIRDRAIAELFYGAGLRLAELTGLRLTELDLAEGLVRVRGKGAKDRVVPLGAEAAAALAAWLSSRPGGAAATVFTTRKGGPLSARAVQKRLALLGLRCGVEGRLYPHRLRHSFASHILQSSGNLRAVQELLGHANLSTTQIYTHLDFQQLARVYDAAHPRARAKRRAGGG